MHTPPHHRRAAGQGTSARRRRAILGVFAIALCLGALPPAAGASTASVSGELLRYDAAALEPNRVTVSTDAGSILVSDPGAVIAPAAGCASIDAHRVRCTGPQLRRLWVRLGDLDDALVIADFAYPADRRPNESPVIAEGGAGVDLLDGGAGPDSLYGGDGDDTVTGGDGADAVIGGELSGGADDGDDVLDGGAGADTYIQGGPGADRITAGAGDDPNVDGGPDADTVDGGPGADDLLGGAGDDRVRGGEGGDRVDVGRAGDPALVSGRDVLEGGPGADRLGPGPPEAPEGDVLSGGDGVDTVGYESRVASGVVVRIDGVANDGEPREDDNVLPDVERVVGGLQGDTLLGGGGAEALDGGPGDDLIAGAGGDDVLDGGVADGGSDTVVGGDGRDTVRGGPGDDALEGGAGDDAVAGGGGSDSLSGESGLDDLAGGPGLDSLDGGDGNDTLYGGELVLVGADGADELRGGAGDDVVVAGAGNDVIDGGPGADRMQGETGRDTVSYEGRSGSVSVTFDAIANDGEPGENDNVAADIEIVIGGVVADTLIGDADRNDLQGDSGDDLIVGGAGLDRLGGGAGIDVLRGRDGAADLASCGQDVDLAILDPQDAARDCEFVDRGGPRRPAIARTAVVRPTRGSARLRLPGASRFVAVRESLRIPLDSTVDARHGEVRLATAADRRGRSQAARFSAGAFAIVQRPGRQPMTELRLRGGDFSRCPATRVRRRGRTVAASAARRSVRRVWGSGRGRYRTKGRYSSGVVRGTTWLTEDRCDGTLTRVVSGTVVVRDLVRRRTVTVRAGHSYLARAPLRRGAARGAPRR